MTLRFFAVEQLGLAYALSFSRHRPVRLVPLMGGVPELGGDLLLTPLPGDYVNVVCVPLGTLVGAVVAVSAYVPDAEDLQMPAPQAAALTAQMGIPAAPAAGAAAAPQVAFDALWTAGQRNVAIVLPANLGIGRAPPPALRELEADALRRYDLVAPHNEHLYSAISALYSIDGGPEDFDGQLLGPLEVLMEGDHGVGFRAARWPLEVLAKMDGLR